ncbi:CBS domain-containing protein [Novispirillum sp. DQ9]|uniref:CBS domain-containing protein n=1 Tax=Novispirillum sp. DQ9 TaxID=3398612 RepID=UPI003C7DB1B3
MATIVPDLVRDQTIAGVAPAATVAEVARMMAERRIAAVVVQEAGRLVGIVTERDMTARVVAAGRDPATTAIADIMTANPDTLRPDQHPLEALRMMADRGYRHLPVVEGDAQVIAMISVRDLYTFIRDELERDLKERDSYIFGG